MAASTTRIAARDRERLHRLAQDTGQSHQEVIGKALEVYAKANNINVIIDGSQVPLVYAADTLDITRAFINDFNSKNPATASVTQP